MLLHTGTPIKRLADVQANNLHPDPVSSAHDAGLRYINDGEPGFHRKRAGKRFIYVDASGHRISDKTTLDRIQSLVIPPAWEDVWIARHANGHIQAIGRDARGRKQYHYHPRWREVRDESKYDRMMAFAKALPTIRRRVNKHLKLPGLPREKVLAAMVRLLETTAIRVGNDEYAKQNKSYGLTTLRNRHVSVHGSKIHFEFRGKSGVEHEIDLSDPRLAKIIHRCQELPDQALFEYIDNDNHRHAISSTDVNAYLRDISGSDFTAKDFRTWTGTLLAAMALQEFEAFDSQTQAKKNVLAAIERVANKLGNTRAVCRKCYIHPAILDSYLDGTMARSLEARTEKKLTRSLTKFKPEEAAVLALLQQRLKREAGRKRPAQSHSSK
jgi:DNA topoisomerase-1